MVVLLIKLAGAIIVIFSCGVCGFAIRYGYSKRIKLLENMNSCLCVIENEIRYMQNDIEKVILKTIPVSEDLNKHIFNVFLDKLKKSDGEQLSSIWADAVESIKNYSYYIRSDIVTLKKFGNILGCGDIDTQMNNISNFRLLITRQFEAATENYKRIGEHSGKIGVYAGVLVAIIFW